MLPSMIKLLAVAVSLCVATPVFACGDKDDVDMAAPKTADKKTDKDKAKEQPKSDAKTDTAKRPPAKTDKTTDKKPGDKVSLK